LSLWDHQVRILYSRWKSKSKKYIKKAKILLSISEEKKKEVLTKYFKKINLEFRKKFRSWYKLENKTEANFKNISQNIAQPENQTVKKVTTTDKEKKSKSPDNLKTKRKKGKTENTEKISEIKNLTKPIYLFIPQGEEFVRLIKSVIN